MEKKEYIKPEMQVIDITPCTLLTKSYMYEGGANSGNDPEPDEDGWNYGE